MTDDEGTAEHTATHDDTGTSQDTATPTVLGAESEPACTRQHDDEIPELDARMIPPVVRPGAILGALGDVRPGDAIIVAAPHDPFPLLAQIDEREGGNVRYGYLQRGPDVWRVLLERVA